MSKHKPDPKLKRIQERLLEQPETIELELAGRKWPFLLGTYGARLAREKGCDPIPVVFGAIMKFAPAFIAVYSMGKAPSPAEVMALAERELSGEILDDMAVIVWSGLLPFEPDLLLEEVEIMLTARSLMRVLEQVYPKVISFAEDETEPVPATEGAEGN